MDRFKNNVNKAVKAKSKNQGRNSSNNSKKHKMKFSNDKKQINRNIAVVTKENSCHKEPGTFNNNLLYIFYFYIELIYLLKINLTYKKK